MTNLKYAVGIDISKKDFKACLVIIDTLLKVIVKASSTFSNSEEGFRLFLNWIGKHKKEQLPIVYLMEATGVYYEKLAWFLYSENQNVAVILPNKAKKYAQSLGIKSKNDKIDAQGLAHMCAQQNLPLWQPMTQNLYVLRGLTRLLENLKDQKTVLTNQLEVCYVGMYKMKELEKTLKGTIKHFEKEIEKIEKEITRIVLEDKVLAEKYKKISTIKGVAIKTFAAVVAETNGFLLFENQRQLVSYAGYDVIENQSGARAGKTKISKKGNSHIRRALHFPALAAVRNNEEVFANLYERIFNASRIKMKGYVGVQKKLLCMIYALWKKDTSFDPNYHKQTLGNHEPKSFFPVPPAGSKKIAPEGATQDRLRLNQSPEAFFPVMQSY